PAPIMPAPRTPTLGNSGLGISEPSAALGRAPPEEQGCMPPKNAWVLVLDAVPVTRETKYRAAICSALAKSTCAPSTAAAVVARGAGEGAPLVCLRMLAGNDGSTEASSLSSTVPPGSVHPLRSHGWLAPGPVLIHALAVSTS